jgi:steroid 5-alpha reductase family enzyme
LSAPALMYWALVHVSGIPPLEEHMTRTRGEIFRTYQRRTRAFVPFPVTGNGR